MTTMDLHDEAVWTRDNLGAEYTVAVPFQDPRLLVGALNVLMLCEGRAFSPEDREHAQRRLDALPQRLDTIFARMREYLGLNASYKFHAAKGTPTLMLEAGDYTRWIFALDTEPQDLSLFVEWENEEITGVWHSV